MENDTDLIYSAMDDFFNNCGAPDDAHANLLLQMVLMEALRPGNKNDNRFWVKHNANVPVSGEKGPQGRPGSHGS